MADRPNSGTDSGLRTTQQARGLVKHYALWFLLIESDFRGASLNRLVAGMVKPGRILDAGCGTGGLTAELLRRGHQVVSLDDSPEMIAMCRQHLSKQGLPSDQVRLAKVEELSNAGEFDTAICLDVIEHIEDDRQALANLRRCLKSDGRLILSVPALSSLYGPKDRAVGHYRRYDKRALLALLQGCGFAVERARYWNALGLLPVWASVKLFKKRLPEDFRYSGRSPLKQALNTALRLWFTGVENRIPWPLGLTLIVCARPSSISPSSTA